MVKNKIWLFVFAAIGLYMLMGVYADFGKLSTSLVHFKWLYVLLLLVLTTVGYFIRYFKWNVLLKSVGVNLNNNESLFVFFSGFSMVITPGRVGELWKSWLIKDISGDPVSKTIPVVIIDRATDGISLVLLSFSGIFYYTASTNLLIGIAVACILIYFAVSSDKISHRLLSLIESAFGKYVGDVRAMHATLIQLIKPNVFLFSVVASALAWFMECIGLYYIVVGFGMSISPLLAIFIFSFASLIGGMSMLPGGIGVAEVGISGLLIYSGISHTLAVAMAILLRFGSFWYGAILGVVVYTLFRNKFTHREMEGVENVACCNT